MQFITGLVDGLFWQFSHCLNSLLYTPMVTMTPLPPLSAPFRCCPEYFNPSYYFRSLSPLQKPLAMSVGDNNSEKIAKYIEYAHDLATSDAAIPAILVTRTGITNKVIIIIANELCFVRSPTRYACDVCERRVQCMRASGGQDRRCDVCEQQEPQRRQRGGRQRMAACITDRSVSHRPRTWKCRRLPLSGVTNECPERRDRHGTHHFLRLIFDRSTHRGQPPMYNTSKLPLYATATTAIAAKRKGVVGTTIDITDDRNSGTCLPLVRIYGVGGGRSDQVGRRCGNRCEVPLCVVAGVHA